MAMLRPWRNAALVAAIWLAGWSAITAQASEIKDDAGLFSAAALRTATDTLNEVEKRNHLPVHIETYATVPADKLEQFKKLQKSEVHNFYKSWIEERAKATNAKGLFVVITKSPGHVEYQATESLHKLGFDPIAKSFADKMLTSFQQKKFDEGLQSATGYLESATAGSKKATPRYNPRPVHPGAQDPIHQESTSNVPDHQVPMQAQQRGGFSMWTWVIVAVVGFLVFRLITGLARSATGGGGMPGQGPGGYGYQQPGYGGGYGGGGGGFMSNMLGGMAGAMAGNWAYNSLFGGSHSSSHSSGWNHSNNDQGMLGGGSSDDSSSYSPPDYGGGGDFGGGDYGGGGDFGGGDSGGGDYGGGGDF